MPCLRCLCLFVGGIMCLFTYSGDQQILCCVFALFFFSFCVPCVANFSGLSIVDCPFGIL